MTSLARSSSARSCASHVTSRSVDAVVFLEDYDMAVSRPMVQGADVWLNTPRRPEEASGTSGMKAAANGVLNASTLDGWWAEAWETFGRQGVPIGWAIGRGEEYADSAYQDQIESEALYDVLERDIIPTFYDRGHDALPRRWIGAMKASIGNLCPSFNTHRMVREYTERFYLPMAEHTRAQAANAMERALALAAWRTRAVAAWPRVAILSAETDLDDRASPTVGQSVRTRARVQLAPLGPQDVSVELYVGRVDADGQLVRAKPVAMHLVGPGRRWGVPLRNRRRPVAPQWVERLHGAGLTVASGFEYAVSTRPDRLGQPALLSGRCINVRVASGGREHACAHPAGRTGSGARRARARGGRTSAVPACRTRLPRPRGAPGRARRARAAPGR